jgi:uncharacterized membrane protein YkvA (DUF1232 family)
MLPGAEPPRLTLMGRIRAAAKALKREVSALIVATRDPRTPWWWKLGALLVIAYALSPIDLIPDFIPVLGVLDDLILVPLGIWLLLKLIPPEVMRDARAQIDGSKAKRGWGSTVVAVVIVALWIGGVAACSWYAWHWMYAK